MILRKIIIAGGSGCIGSAIANHYRNSETEIVMLSRTRKRNEGNIRTVVWDGNSLGPWKEELNGADVLINLTGKNVNCRYNTKNKEEILSSRINSTKVLGEAMQSIKKPPALWIQSSSATIYRHSEDKKMGEETGETGKGFSEQVCKQWEKTFWEQNIPTTRKVLLRIGIVLSNMGGAFPSLLRMTRLGFGGKQGSGNQYVSWIHEDDLINIIQWVIQTDHVHGTYNCTSPKPVRNSEFMQSLRKACNTTFGLPMPWWMLEIGAWLIRTETELILKSRWVIPVKLQADGFAFKFTEIDTALKTLVKKTL